MQPQDGYGAPYRPAPQTMDDVEKQLRRDAAEITAIAVQGTSSLILVDQFTRLLPIVERYLKTGSMFLG